MSTLPVMAAPPAAASARPVSASPAADAAAGATYPRGGWWRAWRARFGLAEVCGTLAAVAGFAAGYLGAGSLLAAAGLATACEAIGFASCAAAEALDGFLIRPGCLAGAAWLAQPLPGGIWLGFAGITRSLGFGSAGLHDGGHGADLLPESLDWPGFAGDADAGL